MIFAQGFAYGAGFTLAAVLMATLMKIVFHLGIC